MKIVLVTGGAGFIGSHLVGRLVSEGYSVRILDNFSSGRVENVQYHQGNPDVEILRGDLKNPQVAYEAVKKIGVVFHFAANPEVRVSTTNPEIHLNENVVATFNILEAMRKSDVKELIFASSSTVYGDPKEIPVSEDAPIKPVSVYGASKAACENLIHAYSHLYGIKALILRYANVVGPRLRHGVVYDFVRKLLENAEILEILGDGTQVRSFIHVNDAIEATLVAWRKTLNNFEVYNIGNEDWMSINEVAETVIKTLGLKNVRYVYKSSSGGVGWLGDVKKIALDVQKLKDLGWRPTMKSVEAVRETVKSLYHELKSKNLDSNL